MSDSHKYRVEVPNVVDDMDLSVYAFRLYARIKRVAGDKGYCREGTRELAERCRMGAASVSRAKDELIEAGLITVATFKGKDEIRVVNIWRHNFETFAPPDSEGEQSVPQGNEVFPRGTDRSNREQSVPQGNTPPDPPIRSEGTKQEPHEDPHTTPARTALVLVTPVAGERVCGCGLMVSLELLRRYARNQPQPLGEGWVGKAFGECYRHEQVRDWLKRQEGPAEKAPEVLNAKNCPDCGGTNFWEPGGRGKGVARCQHKGLYAQLAEEVQARAHAPP